MVLFNLCDLCQAIMKGLNIWFSQVNLSVVLYRHIVDPWIHLWCSSIILQDGCFQVSCAMLGEVHLSRDNSVNSAVKIKPKKLESSGAIS